MAKSSKPRSATSYKETAIGILPRSKVVALEKEGIKRALHFILTRSKKKTQITPQLICDVHRIGFGFIFPKWAGRFRTIPVEVGAYRPPPAHAIPELISNFCNDLQVRLIHLPKPQFDERFLAEVISLLAWFQHRFVWIHPFQDYNGRVGRLLTNLLLLNLGLPVLEIKAETGKDRKRYIQAMESADNYDLMILEDLIAKALKESLEKI